MTEPDVRLRLDGVSVRYPGSDRRVGEDLSLELTAGESVLVLGPSGCGKSTLALVAAGLIPSVVEAELSGIVERPGRTALQAGAPSPSGTAIVFQDPETQTVAATLLDEVCFGLENHLVPAEAIETRARRALAAVGLADDPGDAERSTDELSGGERQRLAIACALALEPALLVLDEPSASLDPAAAARLYETIRALRSPTRTVLIVEHDPELALRAVDRVIVLSSDGRIVLDGTPREVIGRHAHRLTALGIRLPTATRLAVLLGAPVDRPLPLTVDELVAMPETARFAPTVALPTSAPVSATSTSRRSDAPVLEIAGATVRRGGRFGGRDVLTGVELQVRAGELIAVAGVNGAGKSTLARLAAGLLRPRAGTVLFDGRPMRELARRRGAIGYVFQNPEHQFLASTVRDELAFGLRVRGRLSADDSAAVDRMLERFDLVANADRHPLLLSHGEKRRLSVATTLVGSPRLIVLDEPTTGQDRDRATEVIASLRDARAGGAGVIVVTHDLQLAADHADRIALVADGRLEAVETPAELLRTGAALRRAGLPPPPVRAVARRLSEGLPAWAGVFRTDQVGPTEDG